MKISKISPICKRAKRILLLDTGNGEQWVGDGTASYPLLNMPELDEDTIFPALSFSEDDRDRIQIRHERMPSWFDVSDESISETDLGNALLTFDYTGEMLEAYDGGYKNIVFVPSRYIKPVRDCYDNVTLHFRTGKVNYVAVKTGLMLMAIIVPSRPEMEILTKTARWFASGCESMIIPATDPNTGEIME